jgi:hypothetical protein
LCCTCCVESDKAYCGNICREIVKNNPEARSRSIAKTG